AATRIAARSATARRRRSTRPARYATNAAATRTRKRRAVPCSARPPSRGTSGEPTRHAVADATPTRQAVATPAASGADLELTARRGGRRSRRRLLDRSSCPRHLATARRPAPATPKASAAAASPPGWSSARSEEPRSTGRRTAPTVLGATAGTPPAERAPGTPGREARQALDP